jgi:hypothetical protein
MAYGVWRIAYSVPRTAYSVPRTAYGVPRIAYRVPRRLLYSQQLFPRVPGAVHGTPGIVERGWGVDDIG